MKRRTGATNQVGCGFFNASIMTVVPKGKAPGRRARGKKGRKGKCSKARARRDTARPVVAVAKGKGKVAYPLVQVLPRADHLNAYTTGLPMA